MYVINDINVKDYLDVLRKKSTATAKILNLKYIRIKWSYFQLGE